MGRDEEIKIILGSLQPNSRTFIIGIEGVGGTFNAYVRDPERLLRQIEVSGRLADDVFTLLVELERSGVRIDACRDCRGVFLDRGELERLRIAFEERVAEHGDLARARTELEERSQAATDELEHLRVELEGPRAVADLPPREQLLAQVGPEATLEAQAVALANPSFEAP